MRSTIFSITALAVAWMVAAIGNAAAQTGASATVYGTLADKRVLFVSSYHLGFHTLPRQLAGLDAGFDEFLGHGTPPTVDIEFMDTKRLGTGAFLEVFRDVLRAKLETVAPYDLIIVGDDNALNFALEERDGLFRGLPIVFESVNNVELARSLTEDPQITGVIEKVSISETMELAKALLPKAPRMWVVIDDSNTGRVNYAQLKAQLGEKPPFELIILSLEDLTHAQLFEELAKLGPKDPVLLLTAFRDHTGDSLTRAELFRRFRSVLQGPLFYPFWFEADDGPVGGRVVSYFEQGKRAAILAARILSGTPAAELGVVLESPNPYVIDVAELERHGLSAAHLPDDAIQLNKTTTIAGIDSRLVWAGAAFIILESALIALLIWNHFYRRRARLALEQGERRFRDIASTSSDWFWEADADLRLTELSDRFEAVTGQNPASRLGTSHLQYEDLAWNADNGAQWENHRAQLEAQAPFRNFEYALVGPDGERRYESISGTPIFDQGVLIGYRGTGSDITEEYERRNQLLDAINAAELANRTKSAFLANMSHELRTPLNAIIGFSEILTGQLFGKLENERYLDYAKDINDTGKHLLTVLNDLLDISRIEAGFVTLDEGTIDIRQMIRSCARMLSDRVTEAGLSLTLDIPPDLPALYGDETRLRQVLINLLINSVKFTPRGGSISMRAESASDGGIDIEVTDTGVGISEEDLERVMEPFQQAEQALSRTYGGVGLGLSLARNLTELHGGTISLMSKEGVGTKVRIRLPTDRVRVFPASAAAEQQNEIKAV